MKNHDTEIEDCLDNLDKLTQEEARMAFAESLKVAHSADGKFVAIDDRIKDFGDRMKEVGREVLNARSDMQDLGSKAEGIEDRAQAALDDMKDFGGMTQIIASDLKDLSSKILDDADKLDQMESS